MAAVRAARATVAAERAARAAVGPGKVPAAGVRTMVSFDFNRKRLLLEKMEKFWNKT